MSNISSCYKIDTSRNDHIVLAVSEVKYLLAREIFELWKKDPSNKEIEEKTLQYQVVAGIKDERWDKTLNRVITICQLSGLF